MEHSRTDTGLDRALVVAPEPVPVAPPPPVTEADRRIARVLLTGLVVGGAWLVLRVPSLRRVAWRAGRAALVGWLPSLLAREAREAWRHAAPTRAGLDQGVHTPTAAPPPGPFSRT